MKPVVKKTIPTKWVEFEFGYEWPIEASLERKNVLVQFWTFTCINWLRTLPYIRAWAEKYRNAGLVVLGVHAPEFVFERSLENVRRSAGDMKVDYPVAIDNDFAIWRAFGNQYWPALYLLDGKGTSATSPLRRRRVRGHRERDPTVAHRSGGPQRRSTDLVSRGPRYRGSSRLAHGPADRRPTRGRFACCSTDRRRFRRAAAISTTREWASPITSVFISSFDNRNPS